ncbi:hypothetical protein VMCG_10553 [Cytospora schulzeri]|uniref:FAD-binding domain-containing protein n=1 Tax=Cytospora schulzeri TaxID=448051 RepID=A0A423VAD4_9PEZI|nr:hypothetical protein VMCG_10553 [Valsa malicola]
MSEQYHTAGGTPDRFAFPQPGELGVTGVFATTIVEVGSVIEYRRLIDGSFKETLVTWIGFGKKVLGLEEEDAICERFSRVVCGSCVTITDQEELVKSDSWWRRTTDQDMPSEPEWRDLVSGNIFNLDRDYEGGLAAAVSGRYLFVTDTNSMGLCNSNARVGGQIWVIFGSRVPLVLREARQHENSRPGSRYHLISDCFLEGAMDGEALVGMVEAGLLYSAKWEFSQWIRVLLEAPILIIGAGVAGLTLAQGLRLRSVPFLIFERHAQSHDKQGHRLRISRDGQAALNSVLSPELQDLLRCTAAAKYHFAPRYVDARKLDFARPEPVDPVDSMPLDRTWLRMLASLELQDNIRYEKEFDSYEIVEGLVQVKFTDGSVARGQLLVGADGIKSRVRKQFQPDRKLLDLERWVMWGRTPMTDDLRRKLQPPDLLSWCMCMDYESNVQTIVEPITWSKSVRLESESKLPDFPDYVYWVVCTALSQYADHLPKTVREKKQYLARVSETWHPALKHLLGSATHEISACVPIQSSKPDIQICSTGQTRRVTLIGDAAHPMSPMGGSGGDTAIRTAADLARTLAEQGVTERSIMDFEARMEAISKEKIEHSFRGGQKFWRGKEWTGYSEADV